ncbi:hypothetical protein [Pseudomonas sp.]
MISQEEIQELAKEYQLEQLRESLKENIFNTHIVVPKESEEEVV